MTDSRDNKDRTFAVEVGRRLRVTAWELGYRSQSELAELVGATRPQVSAWFNAVALPPVKYMRKLTERGVTLDWLYSGDGSGLTNALYIRLAAAMEMDEPPPDAGPEPEPAQDSGAADLPMAQKSRRRYYRPTSRRRSREESAA